MTLARLKSVAGVTIPDTALCNSAVDLLESSSPEFLCTHCLRTYIFASLAVRGLGRSVVDEEAAFAQRFCMTWGWFPPTAATTGLRWMARMPRASSARGIG